MARIVGEKKTFLSERREACEKPGLAVERFLRGLPIASKGCIIPCLLTVTRASALGGQDKPQLQQRAVTGNSPTSHTVAPRLDGRPNPDVNHKTALAHAGPRGRVLSGARIRRSGRKKRVPGSLTPVALGFHLAPCPMLQGPRVNSDSRIVFLFGCLCSGSCVRQTREGQTTSEYSQREPLQNEEFWPYAKGWGTWREAFSSGRRGWRKCDMSHSGLSGGRRLGSG